MALRAGGRHVQRVDGRLRVADEPDAVRAVAADAGRHLGVALGELLPVHAGRVLGGLIDALLRRVLAHQRRIAVASRADRDDLLRRVGLPLKPVDGALAAALSVARGIAAVAIDAA